MLVLTIKEKEVEYNPFKVAPLRFIFRPQPIEECYFVPVTVRRVFKDNDMSNYD